jgi:hypothetical protein
MKERGIDLEYGGLSVKALDSLRLSESIEAIRIC